MLGRPLSRSLGCLTVLAVLAAGAWAGELPVDRGVGQGMPNFTLKDVATGEPVSLNGFRGKPALVLVFTGTDCPVSNLYAPRLVELHRAYKDKDVAFLAINANARETVEEVARHAREHGIDFPVLKDQDNLVADLALAERTCEVVLLDGQARIRYRGAIDDQYGQGPRKDAPAHNYLRDALDALLAGRPVEPGGTPVAGCLLDKVEARPALKVAGNAPRVRPAAPEIVAVLDANERADAVEVGAVAYARDVAPIVQNKCQSCHRPSQVAPFSLMTYDDARRHAAMIREVVDDRRMPPWHADPRFGHFQNDRSLSARERGTLLAWVDQGTPLGDPGDLPPARTFPPDGWAIGTPDRVFEIPEPYAVAAQGTLDYVYLRVPSGFTEDRWVQAAEARPGDRSVVHHIIVFVVPPGQGGQRRRGQGHLCGYAPGDMPSVYPPGSAKKIPAGSELVFQIHYTPNGRARVDRSKVGLIFAKAPVEHEAHTLGIAQQRFIIPAGAANHEVRSSFTFPSDAHLLSFMPHMHLRGKSFEYKVTYPDGRSEVLLSVPAFDFGWQSYYILDQPKAMPQGTRIDCLAHFDNSAGNPYNPAPDQAVAWGDQTYQEMMIGYIDFIDDAPAGAAPKPDTPARKPAALAPSRAGTLLRALRSAANPR
jgi:peroxiredoxin